MERACLALQAPTTHSTQGQWEASSARAGAAAGAQQSHRDWDGFLPCDRLVTAPGEAAGNEQVPQARVRAEERGKDQGEAINRGRKNPGDTDPARYTMGR